MKRNKVQPATFSEEDLRKDILLEARVVKLPAGTAEVIATKVAEQTAKWVKRRSAVTDGDINRKVAQEIAKYSPDLAYVYQNRGKII